MGNVLNFGKKSQEPTYNQNNLEDFRNDSGSIHGQAYLELLKAKESTTKSPQDKLAAVIVSLESGGSYDELFTAVEQKSLEGTRVQVYKGNVFCIKAIMDAMNGDPSSDIFKQLVESINKVDKDCVVFNWECCGHYGNENFGEGKDQLFSFLKMIVQRGHMAMFSDFSLKALIKEWKGNEGLGPNPFKKTGQFNGQFELRFKSGELKECPSAQLQSVGQLADGDRCNVQAISGTITYSVDKTKLDHNIYQLQVLTVVSNIKPPSASLECQVGDYKGSAGHTLLTYPSGGMILTSMGHWIELMKIDTSQKKLFEMAAQEYGAGEAMRMQAEYDCLESSAKQSYLSKNAREFVQNQAPCMNMAKKSMW